MSDQRTEQAMAPTNQGNCASCRWSGCSPANTSRADMSQDALEELANSIRAQGVIQPIVVRSIGENRFEIIAGERRWRASQLARLEVVPCLVKDVADEAAVAIAPSRTSSVKISTPSRRPSPSAPADGVRTDSPAGCRGGGQVPHHGHQPAAPLNQLNEDVKRLEHGDLDMGHARALLALSGQAQSELANWWPRRG